MLSHKKVTLISIIVIVCVILLCEVVVAASGHHGRLHELSLRQHRVKRAPQNPISTTTSTTARPTSTTANDVEGDDEDESKQGFGHTLLNVAKFMIQQVRILIQAIMSN